MIWSRGEVSWHGQTKVDTKGTGTTTRHMATEEWSSLVSAFLSKSLISIVKSDDTDFYINIYQGEFSENFAKGKGHYQSYDGSSYQGNWQFNRPHGLGDNVAEDYTKYVGEYFNGMKHGKGLVVWPNNANFQG